MIIVRPCRYPHGPITQGEHKLALTVAHKLRKPVSETFMYWVPIGLKLRR